VFHKVALKRFLASSRHPARWGAAQKVGSKKVWVEVPQEKMKKHLWANLTKGQDLVYPLISQDCTRLCVKRG